MLIDEGIGAVAGDAAEGINPSHDLCRFLIDGAVALVERRTGRALLNYDFVLDSRPDAAPEAVGRDALWLELDAAAVERKIVAARGYPELRGEVEGALARFRLRPSELRRWRGRRSAVLALRVAVLVTVVGVRATGVVQDDPEQPFGIERRERALDERLRRGARAHHEQHAVALRRDDTHIGERDHRRYVHDHAVET